MNWFIDRANVVFSSKINVKFDFIALLSIFIKELTKKSIKIIDRLD